ncbi:MAG TPA: disulfide bond formation protein B [Methylophilaceae bacterium]|nr:disulfide bond formation protein B [Methylophilaceae bacterium]
MRLNQPMLNKLIAGRSGYLLGFLASFGLVALALFIQQKYNLEPCPLCISQRIAFMALGVLFLIAAIHNPAQLGRRIYGVLHVIAALAGSGISLRHIWVQNHADEIMAECGVGFDYMFENFPLSKALQLVFKGTGDCAKIDWTMFGLTIPQLSLICFVVLAIYALVLVRR